MIYLALLNTGAAISILLSLTFSLSFSAYFPVSTSCFLSFFQHLSKSSPLSFFHLFQHNLIFSGVWLNISGFFLQITSSIFWPQRFLVSKSWKLYEHNYLLCFLNPVYNLTHTSRHSLNYPVSNLFFLWSLLLNIPLVFFLSLFPLIFQTLFKQLFLAQSARVTWLKSPPLFVYSILMHFIVVYCKIGWDVQ